MSEIENLNMGELCVHYKICRIKPCHAHCDEYLPKKYCVAERPRGKWVDVPKYKGFYVCSKCLERLNGDFERFDHWEMKKDNFCSVCGSDNRKICPVYSDSEVKQPCMNCLECEIEGDAE